MQFVDATIPTGMRLTNDGYLVGEVRCARTGCQQYMAREIGLQRDGLVNVYRPETAVFDKDSLATFAGKPVTVGHPSEAVTADNWRQHAVGDVGTDIARDGEFVRVPIKLMDAAAIKSVQSGTREISMGYTTDIKVEDGTAPDGTPYQAIQIGPIRINHLAIVPRARGGSELRIGDGAVTWGAAPIIPATDKETITMSDALRTVVVDGLSVSTTDQGAHAIAKLQADLQSSAAKLTDAEKSHTATIAKKDEEIGALKADLKKAQDALPKPADLDKMVADRAALVTVVKAIDAKIDPAGKTDADLRKAAVSAKLGDEMVKDASDAEIAGMFKAIAKDIKAADPVRTALINGRATVDANDNGQSAYEKRLSDAWKGPVANTKEA